MQKPSIPKGTRDFGPAQVARRQHIFNVIRRTFESFGYAPLETPTLENLSVLTGKYGDEGDQLLFKVLNSGDFAKDVTAADLETGSKALLPKVAEKGLRYDLTVPFARYVAMNRGTLTFPFKRYQMQPVWRADRPQRGRYREFYQCDADVVGTDSLLCEAEIVLMMAQVLNGLGLDDFTIKINHRAILDDIHQAVGGVVGQEGSLYVAIDKLDKIGRDGVTQELLARGFSKSAIDRLFELLSVKGTYLEKIHALSEHIRLSIGTDYTGYTDLREVYDILQASGFKQFDRLEFDPTLARGLSYYTGCIFEVKINNVQMGSVSGGGRYDNLTGSFGLPGVSGVGFSFGVDRLYDCLEALDLFTSTAETPTRCLLTHFDAASGRAALPLLAELRAAGIPSELYPDASKLQKQFKYADAKGIPLVIIMGPEEAAAGVVKIKIMQTGVERVLPVGEVVAALTVE
ncbi:MAG TPA: histidine--tRNA ligase [Hymenobacter sp.]|jgi:histidyl-tRNA synthetase|uniref:histidine--tRNA ligase n=1 Tax=Hymenobacter sp. TaxID=1898978 RepID=UPI002ED82DCB